MTDRTLYNYFRSTAAYRVRIALNLKGLDAVITDVNLLEGGGEQYSDPYRKLNPQGLVPSLIDNDQVFTQSIAIIEYLEEAYPTPPLLPQGLAERAYVRSIAQTIACDLHPLNNLRVLQYLTGPLGIDAEQKRTWYHHWVRLGFEALEAQITASPFAGLCCYGDEPTMADLCLIPQIYNAHRFECPMDAYPRLEKINAYCLGLAMFEKAKPVVPPH